MRRLGLSITDILAAFGLTPEIAQAIYQAETDPTSANIAAVTAAYAKVGMVVPGQLYAHLLQINEERHPEDTVRGAAFPWILAALAVGVWLLSRRR